MMDRIPGFAPGIVTQNEDPDGTGRIKVIIPGLLEPETPYWVMPGNWPGGGRRDGKGSQYPPPPIGGQVAVIFEYGIYLDPNSHAFYFSGYYGLGDDGVQTGPEIISEATSAEEALKRTVLWEGEKLMVYMIEDTTEDKLVLEAKQTGSKIELNATDGDGGNSETIYIEARSLLSLYARGMIDIRSDSEVFIQGRRVDSNPTGSI